MSRKALARIRAAQLRAQNARILVLAAIRILAAEDDVPGIRSRLLRLEEELESIIHFLQTL